jgi:hypothetical protein
MQKRFGEYLVEDRRITRDQLARALSLQSAARQGRRLPLIGTILVGMGAITSQDLDVTLREQRLDRMRVPA